MQRLPQAPQLLGSVSVSTHWLELPAGQYIWGLPPELGHVQLPPEQVAPPLQVAPQAPQFAPSLPITLMHSRLAPSPHALVPAGH
jgi:hypothetical protein